MRPMGIPEVRKSRNRCWFPVKRSITSSRRCRSSRRAPRQRPRATELDTEVGKIAGLTESAEEPKTPLDLRIAQFGRWLYDDRAAASGGDVRAGKDQVCALGQRRVLRQRFGVLGDGSDSPVSAARRPRVRPLQADAHPRPRHHRRQAAARRRARVRAPRCFARCALVRAGSPACAAPPSSVPRILPGTRRRAHSGSLQRG